MYRAGWPDLSGQILRVDLDQNAAGDQFLAAVAAGETLTATIEWQAWNDTNWERGQVWLLASWMSLPPNPTICLFDNILGLAPGWHLTSTVTLTLPDQPGRYLLWVLKGDKTCHSVGSFLTEYPPSCAAVGMIKSDMGK